MINDYNISDWFEEDLLLEKIAIRKFRISKLYVDEDLSWEASFFHSPNMMKKNKHYSLKETKEWYWET